MRLFAWQRFRAMIGKEARQLRRDRGMVALTLVLPMIQLFLFGYAINMNPRHLPTALVSADHSRYERDIVTALENTKYFDIHLYPTEQAAEEALRRWDVMFIIDIPPNFERDVLHGASPSILIDADGSDPTAIGNATAAVTALGANVLARDLPPDPRLRPAQAAYQTILHARYNPEQITALNIVPALIAVVLTFSTLVSTAMAITREREMGTMENLLVLPIQPAEVLLGKILPYVALGYLQVSLVLSIAVLVFGVPVAGSLTLLLGAIGLFIACNLALGFVISSLARTQRQAMQMAQFVFLPSMLLSGFLFPFRGMPVWAQVIGDVLPITHMLRIARGVLLKGNGWPEIAPDVWPMAAFGLAIGALAVLTYRRTLD
ncbi:MAG: ABC transporter permease [Rhodospirillales bacterium]|nr:ABC transporter permease [Rhodospirillales bacterium]